jgi:small subunit ribosomal protein S6e
LLPPTCVPLPPLPPQNGKTTIKCPKIQRLVTPQVLQRKRRRAAIKKERITRKKAEAADYHKLLVQRLKEQRERRSESLAKKRALRMASVASKEA